MLLWLNRFTQTGANMDLSYSNRSKELMARLSAFMNVHIYANEARFEEEVAQGDRWQPLVLMEDLKREAQAQGLWNLFLPPGEHAAGLSNYEYAPLAEIMGRVEWAAEVLIARRRILETWKYCSDMGAKNRSGYGWSRCWQDASARRSR